MCVLADDVHTQLSLNKVHNAYTLDTHLLHDFVQCYTCLSTFSS